MDGKLLLAFFGTLLLLGTALAHDPTQQDMNTLHKDRRIAVVNELMKAQQQISKALWKMYQNTVPPGEQEGGPDCSDESKEEAEVDAYAQMKQKKIMEMRENATSLVVNVAKNFLSMSNAIDSIEKKVHKEVKDRQSVVNYNLVVNKRPKRPKHPKHDSSEERSSEEHGNKHPQNGPMYRVSRQLKDVVESVAKVEEEKEPEEVIKTVDGEEVVQTLPK